MARKIMILGATSAIARAAAMAFAREGDELLLCGRDLTELERISADLTVRFSNLNHTLLFDIENVSHHQTFFDDAIKIVGNLDGVVLAVGDMNEDINKTLVINFTGAVSILTSCANYLRAQKKGFIIGITSVAGDRGRKSNYIYGAAKGGLNIYLQGLRNQLFKDNVRVITVKPGFVDTAMTFGLPGMFLVAKPDTIGKAIAVASKKSRDVIYLPWFWRYIMLIIIHIPEFIFKRMSL